MAPEQALGGAVDGRADLYALGVMAYEALAGAPPFAGASLSEALNRRLREEAPPLGRPGERGGRATGAVGHAASFAAIPPRRRRTRRPPWPSSASPRPAVPTQTGRDPGPIRR